MSIGQRIRQRRQILKITQQDLAKAIGMTPQHISLIEQDKAAPSLTVISKLAEQLGVSIDYLVAGKRGIITDVIPAIKADEILSLEAKKALVTMVELLRAASRRGIALNKDTS